MSGSKYKGKSEFASHPSQIPLAEDQEAVENDQGGDCKLPERNFRGFNHLGPLSRKERIHSTLAKISPFVTISIAIFSLFLLATIVSNITKIQQLNKKIDDTSGSVLAKISSLQSDLNNLQRQPGPKGAKGELGTKGDKGVDGVPGIKGIQGEKGETGAHGQVGLKGDKGAKGAPGEQGPEGRSVTISQPTEGSGGETITCIKGETGAPGAKGEKGDTGLQGPKGEEGSKGANGQAYVPYLMWEWKHPAGSKGDRFDFRIDCHRRCRNIDINVSHSSGDVDLYGEDEHVPTIKESNCQGCSQCKSRSSSLSDGCEVAKSSTDKFFFTINVHKDYNDMEVVVEATNLAEVVCVSENCGGEVLNTDLNDGE